MRKEWLRQSKGQDEWVKISLNGSLCGLWLVFILGWYGVMVNILKWLRSKISPARWLGVPMVGNRNGLADMVMCWAGDVSLKK